MRPNLAVLVVLFISSAYALESQFGCSGEMGDDKRAIFLEAHNELRRRVALGKEENKFGYLGPARNMYQLNWDCTLEDDAANSIADCRLDSTVDSARNNIALSGGYLPDELLITLGMYQWENAVKFFGKSEPTNVNDGTLCTFANMVHANTTSVGCAYKSCNSNFLITCLYDKCGTKEPLLWEIGTACKEDKDCTTYEDSKCVDSLCVVD
ncbi:SCP-like protein [Necator americanus]|uniref:SCP-like protein n=1 Tax=Necator americanus TaxID=51031 RepID=W2TMM6_NECAM|nr:SCP-like protein [Necator americanus]ETN82914.1 SCP-like protein [Necator americanus]